MCPAYKVSHDETFSTRARANILREVLTRGTGNFDSPEMAAVLDSCLACKGCLSECPSNVDMTRIRSEVLQQKYDRHGTPLRSWLVARMASMESLGACVRPLYNFFATWKPSAALIKRMVRFSADRQIPTLSRFSMRKLVAMEPQPANGRKVYLFVDEFTDHQEAELGLTFVKLLNRLGYRVEIPKHGESGRAAISKGCLKLARRFAVRNVTLLRDIVTADAPLVGIEPSCILSFRDEYPDLVPPEMRDAARDLAANCLLFDEFIMREVAAGRISSDAFRDDPVEVWLHGHCHQKALMGIDKTAAALRLLPGATVHVIPSGCCGMAGSFGYEKEHYRRSLEIGETVLFPAVRHALGLTHDISSPSVVHVPSAVFSHNRFSSECGSVPQASDATTAKCGNSHMALGSTTAKCGNNQPVPAVVVAPGTSCRQQILDGTGAHAVHPVELLYNWLR